MTAKTAWKQFSIFFSIAISASAAHAQRPEGAGELLLAPTSTLLMAPAKEPAKVPAEVAVKPRSSQPVEEQTATSPPRIQRSVLETPRITSVPVVTPAAEQRSAISLPKPTVLRDQTTHSAIIAAHPQVVGEAELIRGRYPDGKPHVERWVAEDALGNIVNHGQYTEYDQAGTIIASGKYESGQHAGEWTKQLSFEETQSLVGQFDKAFQAPFSSRATFRHGELHGTWTITDAQGKTLAVWTYADGKRQGSSKQFDPNGDVTQALNYEADLADGPARMPADGGIVKETTFSNGMMLRQVDKWHPVAVGKQRVLEAQEWHLVPMPLNVASSDWTGNRIKYRSTEGIEPIRHGMSVTFYPNGQRESEGTYDHGKRTGTFAWWYANGQQKTVGEYRDDVEHSEWNWWHENGMKHVSGAYVDGRQTNEWSSWSAEGKLVSRTEVSSGTQVADRSPAEAAPVNR